MTSDPARNSRRTSSVHPNRVLRLDRIEHPFGPCPAALEAIEAVPEASAGSLAMQLRQQLGRGYRLSPDAIRLYPGADAALHAVIDVLTGPIVTFPPSATSALVERTWPEREMVFIRRGVGQGSEVESDVASDLPIGSIALAGSPADPLGTLLAPADAVRLARACRYLIIDERYAEFGGQSLLRLASEFDNIVIVRSFEGWAGLERAPCAWVVASPRLASRFGTLEHQPGPCATAAAIATLDNAGAVEATLKLVREERSRLYRLLRKFSFLEPLPSWGPFVTARAAAGQRDEIVARLFERGVRVHAPAQPGLERHIRIGIGTRSAMERLRTALLDLAPELMR